MHMLVLSGVQGYVLATVGVASTVKLALSASNRAII